MSRPLDHPENRCFSPIPVTIVFLVLLIGSGASALAGTHLLTGITDNSADTSLCGPPVDVQMFTISSNADKGGNDATDTTVTVGGTVVAADVAQIRVLYGGVQEGSITNPGSLTGVNIALPGNTKGGSDWTFHVVLNASAAGKTFNLTVTSINGSDNAVLPSTTATRNANACANTPPTATVTNPANGSAVTGTSSTVDGTANDTDGTVTAVDVQIQRQDTSEYWNGGAWQAGAVWLAATGTTSWSYSWTVDTLDLVSVNVTARATDNLAATGTDTNTCTVDNLAPREATAVRFQALPTSGDANFTLLSDWTEADPGTPTFDYNLNAAGYLGAVAGSAGNASSRIFAVALNGDDRFFAIKSEHTDANGNGPTLSEDTTLIYVLPLTPPAPTVNGATTSSLEVTIAANGGETGVSMVYAIAEAGGQYVQADGTLGVSPVWRTLAAWGSPVTVTGLADNTTYTFSVAAGNPSDASPTTGERSASAFGIGAAGTTLPIVLDTTTVEVNHSQAGCDVTINAVFTGDADNDGSTLFEFKTGTNCNGGGYATIAGCGAVSGGSPRSCVHNAAANTDYCYQVTFSDPDGVNGTNPIRYGSINTGACGGTVTTSVGDGTNPGAASICPNATGDADAFTLVTDSGADTVISIQVTLAAEADIFNRVASVEITSDDGVTVYGTVNNPAANVVNVAVTIPVSTTAVQYRVRITAEDHANLVNPTHTVTATVTDIAVTDAKSVTDTAGTTLTIDNTAPADATWGTITPSDGQVSLAWTNPGGDFAEAIIVRNTSASVTFSPTDGSVYVLGQNVGGVEEVRSIGSGVNTTDATVVNGSAYYYKIFTRDACGNWSAGVETGPHTPTSAAIDAVTAGTSTGNVDGCNQITISAPFSNDDNNDSTTAVRRGTAPGGPFGSTICASLSGVSPRTCVDSTVVASSTYYYQVEFTDADGVNGANPQVVGPLSTPACSANDTTVTSNSATATTCKQITVTSIFTGDADGDGSTLVEYFDGAWQTGCATVTGSSPRQCVIPELAASTSYDIRITFSDPDGVSGTNPETLSSVTTPACSGDQTPPTALVLVPARDAVLGGVDVLKIQVYDDTGIASVQVSVDGDPYAAAAVNANYTCGTGCSVYEYTIDTTGLTNEAHYFTVRVTDTGAPTANVTLVSQPFVVYNSGVEAGGDGFLLRRTRSSQMCIDCHEVQSHSSQATSTKYGAWGIDCVTCHTPHLTENIYLIREQITTPNSGTKSVSFTATTTGTDYVATTAPYDGVCNVCHTRTNHHRNDDSGGDHTHNTTGACISCHGHNAGFAGSGCDGCHNAPPTTGAHGKHIETGAVPSSYTDLTSTATSTQYGFSCAKCHQGTHDAQMVAPSDKLVEVTFDSTADPKNPTGSYVQGGVNNYDDGVVIGDNIRWVWTDGTCSNLYCHSRANPLGGTDATAAPTWNSGAMTCTSCHDTGGAASNLSPTHRLHTDAATYSYGCVRCHNATVADNTTIDDKTVHVNGVKNVLFDATTPPDNSAGSYDSGAYTCSNTYCHSNGQDLTAPYTSGPSIAWNTTRACDSCHDNADPAATSLSAAHFTHTETDGYTYGCERCHSDTVTDSTTIGTFANHVNAVQDVAFDTSGPNNSGGSYNSGGETCSNTYCHSDGKDLAAPYTSGPSLAWTGTTTCTSCHDTAGAAATNLSAAHFLHTETDGYAFGCERCHANTVSNSTTISNPANHVNAVQDVFFDNSGVNNSGGSYNSGGETCSNTYCHSNGTDLVAPYTSAASTAWTGARTCTSCHGTGDGAPSYVNGSPKANSHDKHVPAYSCNVCHATVSDATPSIIDKSLHVNGAYNVVAGGGYSFSASGSPSTCASNGCHGDLTWGQTGSTCRNCHGKTGIGDQDVDDWSYGNGTTAIVDMEDWTSYGHGNTGTYAESTNTGADFDNGGGSDGCLYCHDTGVGHNNAGNPFRLRNVGAAATVADKIGVCTACHGGGGVDPDGGGGLPAVDSALEIDAYHYGTKHGASGDGGTFCWDCHDPHGDYNYGSTQRLAYMVDETPTQDHSGSGGWGVPTTVAPGPDFRANRDGGGAWDWGDYVASTTSGGFYRGVCQVCHTGTTRFRQDANYDANHYETNGRCVSCHDHDQPPSDAFKPAGGGCLGCHENTAQGGRRQVGPDFSKNSHHVGSGGANMGGTLTDADCVVCHAEGEMVAGEASTTALHNEGSGAGGAHVINLKDADNLSNDYPYDKAAMGATSTWGSGNANWENETSTTLDPFCLTCHDANGATAIGASLGEAGASALNPFNDAAITNEYDQWDRGRVVDIASRVVSSGSDLDAGGEPRGPDGVPDPPQGIYARHAIRGQSVSIYGSQQIGGAYWVGSWNDTSVMGCADCHTTDGKNTTAGNAHGSNSEYLLMDGSGGASEGNSPTTYVCALCHDSGAYVGATHTPNSGDFQDYTANTGVGPNAGRVPQGNTGGNIYGMACTNCHGGVQSKSGVAEYGTIHGTSQTMGLGQGGTGTRLSYRFMNGNSMRWYDPQGWTGTSSTCYTLANGDTFGGCTKHDKGGSLSKPAASQRPLSY